MPQLIVTPHGYCVEFQQNKWDIIAPQDDEWQLETKA